MRATTKQVEEVCISFHGMLPWFNLHCNTLLRVRPTAASWERAQVLQITMGTGFKCISTVWRARRRVVTPHDAWQPAKQPYDRHAPGWLRPRALRIALEQESAEKGADAPSARALAAELVRV